MEDLLEAILGEILGVLGEILMELLMGVLADLLARAIRPLFVVSHRMGPVLSSVIIVLAGCTAGYISFLMFPHLLVHTRRIPGASLLISPIAAGFGMSFIGWMVGRRGGRRARIETFRYGFAFALAMAITRFALVTRP